MSLLRCFLAIEVPSSIQDAIATATAAARSKLGSDLVRWAPPRNVHLTLKFLGDTAPSGIDLIQAALTAETRQYQPFEAEVAGFGAFPNIRKPRVLWVGVGAPGILGSLQHELDIATDRLGYSSEDRSFSPHLTIGRVRQNLAAASLQIVRDELEQTTVGRLGSYRVEEVHLFKSELNLSGSIYTKLFTSRLGQA